MYVLSETMMAQDSILMCWLNVNALPAFEIGTIQMKKSYKMLNRFSGRLPLLFSSSLSVGVNKNVQHSKLHLSLLPYRLPRTTQCVRGVKWAESSFSAVYPSKSSVNSSSSWNKMPKTPTIPTIDVDKTMWEDCQLNSGSYLHHPGEFWQTLSRWED